MLLAVLTFVTILPSFILAAQPICYWPSGKVVDAKLNYLPCPRFDNSNTTTVQCCKSGEACLSNGLCYGAAVGVNYRGACTDRSWKDPICPTRYCAKDYPDSFVNIYQCPPRTPNDGVRWWCGNRTLSPACKEGGGSFVRFEGAQIKLPIFSSTPLKSSSTTLARPIPTVSNSSSSMGGVRWSTTTVFLDRPSYVPFTLQIVQTVTASPPPSLPQNASPSNTASNSSTSASQNSKVATAIGAGVGIPLGVLALAGVGFLLLSRRRNGSGKEEKNGGYHTGRGILGSGHRPQELHPDPQVPRQEMNTVQTPLEPPVPGFSAIITPPTPTPDNRAPQLPQLPQSPPLLMQSQPRSPSSPHPLHPSYHPQYFPPPSHLPPSSRQPNPLQSPSLKSPLMANPPQPSQPILFPSHTPHPPHPFQSPESSQPSPPSPNSAGSLGSVSSAYPTEPLQSTAQPLKSSPTQPSPQTYRPPPGPPPPQIYPPPSRMQLPS